ncbi:MAG: hypothetical protein WBC78_19865 [Candidatus Sulfotelmatobacter sp.]
MRTFAIAITVLGFGFAGVLPAEHAVSPSTEPAFLYTVAKRYDALAWMNGGERFPSGSAVFISDSSGQQELIPSFTASADPAVSFNGNRALFAGKSTPQDPWQIWEISLDGSDLRRITNCAQNCIRPFYLPETRIVYAEKVNGHFVIQSTSLDGGKPLTLTYWPGNSLPTDVLRDGRVLFESAFPSGEKGLSELYTVYSDGSGVESYRCDHGTARQSGKQIGSGDIVFAASGGLARFTSALAKQVQIPAPPGEYAGDVDQTSSGEWLLPWRPNRNAPYQLVQWKPGQTTLHPALKVSGSNVLEPVLAAERAVPNRHPSGLHEWTFGNLLCLTAYTSKYKFAAGSIRSVRLYTKDGSGVQILGTAPVEADGSFFVQVPGDQPLQIELLDGTGKTLKRETGWFWLRRGEQRACVGCHAGPETAPENAVPMILLKSTTPADMAHASPRNSAGGQ